MLAAPEKTSTRTNVALIGGLTVVMLGAMAFAVPAGPIPVRPDARGGVLLGHGRLSELQAELVARQGHRFLVVDFTGASMGDDAFWRDPFSKITQRGFRLWAYVSLAADAEVVEREARLAAARELVRRARIETLIVNGPGAVQAAEDLAAGTSVRVLPVTPPGVELSERAAVVGPDEVSQLPGVLPIVDLSRLSDPEQAKAKALVEQRTDGEYVLSYSAVR